MAEPHLSLCRLRVLLPRGPSRRAGQGDATRPASKIPTIHGGGLLRTRVSAPLDLQLCRRTHGRRSAFVQTGNTPRSFLPSIETG